MRYVIYARVSTQEQGLGIEDQIQRCRDFILRRDEIQAGQFMDRGVSGSIPLLAREYGKLLLNCQPGDTVLALCQDRLFRSVADMLLTVETLAEKDIHIATVDEGPLDLEDDDKWLGAMIRALFAELERRRVRTRTRRALAQAKEEGRKIGEAPYGWTSAGNGRHVPEPSEQLVVAKILDMDALGLSNREIARQLNDGKHLTRDGKEWSHPQIGRVLQRNGAE